MMPSYFFAHGAPSIVLEDNEYTQVLKNFKDHTPRPKAIVLFSAHWEESVQTVGAAETYETIYDFGGFQDELYEMTYPAKSDRLLSKQVQSLFTKHGIQSVLNEKGTRSRGMGGSEAVISGCGYPGCRSIREPDLSNEQQYQIGKALSELREQDILIIGSGGTVHNLRRLKWRSEEIDEWAEQFQNWIQSKLESWDMEALFQYRELAPYAQEAVPTNEHFIPLLLAMGTGDSNRQAKLLHRSYQYGNLSLSCWQFN